jgi:hypothetical protein
MFFFHFWSDCDFIYLFYEKKKKNYIIFVIMKLSLDMFV